MVEGLRFWSFGFEIDGLVTQVAYWIFGFVGATLNPKP